MTDYAVPPGILKSSPRVFVHTAGGREVVVKRAQKPDAIFVHVFQNALAKILREPMMLRTDAIGGDGRHEVKKLRILREKGLNVPEVLYEGDGYFVMEHAGECLEAAAKKERDAARADGHIAAAVRSLRRLHEEGFAHGGAQFKNFTIRGGDVFMIDFEEVIPEGYDEAMKLRDILLFLMSLETAGMPRGLDWICRVYDEAGGGELCARIASSLRRYRFLRFLNNSFFSRIPMNDVHAAVSLVEKAERLLRPRREDLSR
jgi:tRNA A-37 threonylcarbamoyl transferase component Bud32